jgi:flagellar hook-associated protein 1 FlgK
VADLFTSLTTAARSLEAQRFGLDATGQNIANVNTPGYTRRVVDFAAVPPSTKFSAGGGVTVTDIRSQRDLLLEGRLRQESTASQREAALAGGLAGVELALGSPDSSIDAKLAQFFDSFARLADSPTSPVARQEVALQGENLAAAFRETAGDLEQARRDVNTQLGGTIDEINALAARIASLNGSLGGLNQDPARLEMADEQTELLRQLSELTDIRVVAHPGGGVDVDIAGGRALVVGESAYALTGTATGPDGMLQVSIDGTDITAEITGGRAGGLLTARDERIPAYMSLLDEQAFALADAVNTIHAGGYDLNGNTGQDFFAFSASLSGSQGAARALVMDAAVAADPSRVAASGTAIAGGNDVARALADVRDARVLAGGSATLHEGWSQLTYRVGRDVRTAEQESAMRQEVVRQVETLRDQVSGISLDEEAMQLMRFQRAYEANARFFRVIDQTLDVLLNTFTR